MVKESLKPKDHFIGSVKPYFEKKGYVFSKSKNQFERPTLTGSQVVLMSFLRYGSLVEAQLLIGVRHHKLEKLFGEINKLKSIPKTEYTFVTEFNNLPEIRFGKNQYRFELYDRENLAVTSAAIENSTEKFIKAFEQFGVPFLEHYISLENVQKKRNALPISYPSIINFTNRHIAFGLILAAAFNPRNYEGIHESYKDYVAGQVDAIELEKVRVLTNEFLKHNDIQALLQC